MCLTKQNRLTKPTIKDLKFGYIFQCDYYKSIAYINFKPGKKMKNIKIIITYEIQI